MNEHGHSLYSLPGYALYWELALAAWIVWQIATGKCVYKRMRFQREDDPRTFWLGIVIQALLAERPGDRALLHLLAGAHRQMGEAASLDLENSLASPTYAINRCHAPTTRLCAGAKQ